MYSEYNYQPTDLDEELFLSDVPIELLQNSIDTQFQEPTEYRKKDYVQSFIMKYQFSKENMFDDDLIMLDLKYDNFIAFIGKTFYDYLQVGFPNIGDGNEEDTLELIHLTYRFFIKNIKKNFVNIVINHIMNDKDYIISNYEKKKDVTSINFKLEIDDDYDVLLLSNLGSIIDDLFEELRQESDVDRFFSLCEYDEPLLELEFVKHAYDELELTGNFVEPYIDMVDDDFKNEIQSKVRNKILKKYPKRISKREEVKLDIEEDDTEE